MKLVEELFEVQGRCVAQFWECSSTEALCKWYKQRAINYSYFNVTLPPEPSLKQRNAREQMKKKGICFCKWLRKVHENEKLGKKWVFDEAGLLLYTVELFGEEILLYDSICMRWGLH